MFHIKFYIFKQFKNLQQIDYKILQTTFRKMPDNYKNHIKQ